MGIFSIYIDFFGDDKFVRISLNKGTYLLRRSWFLFFELIAREQNNFEAFALVTIGQVNQLLIISLSEAAF